MISSEHKQLHVRKYTRSILWKWETLYSHFKNILYSSNVTANWPHST